MSKSVFVIAVIAAACSSVAFAGEVKKDKSLVVKATTMTDAELERVSAGAAQNNFVNESNTQFPINITGSCSQNNCGSVNNDKGALNFHLHVFHVAK